LTLMILHPGTNSLLAGLGQVMLYLSVLAPVFWVASLVHSPARLARILGIVLVCSGIDAMVGVLQVYDPDRWMPGQLSQVIEKSYDVRTLSYRNAQGKLVLRPPGLSDNPGAVCGPAAAAALIGLIFSSSAIAVQKRFIAILFAFA